MIVSTGQHRDMLDQMLAALNLKVDIELGVMKDHQSLPALTSRLIARVAEALDEVRPDAVVVQGDTTSAFTGALAAFYARVPVGHVEAGLRSGSLDNPFPEELNRRLISQMARWNFAPTVRAASDLRNEGVPEDRILVTGNTVVDNLLWVLRSGRVGCSPFVSSGRHVLVTLHRRETQGPAMHAAGRGPDLSCQQGRRRSRSANAPEPTRSRIVDAGSPPQPVASPCRAARLL